MMLDYFEMKNIQKIIKNLSINKKLLFLTMSTAIIAVLLSCTAFIMFILYEERRDIINEIIHVGNIVKKDLSHALASNNTKLLDQIIHSISLKDSIVQSCVYDMQDNVITEFNKDNQNLKCLNIPVIYKRYDFINLDKKYLFVRTELKLSGNKVGILYTVSKLDLIYLKIIRSIYSAFFVLILILLICYKVSKILQKNVSEPILQLANISYKVKSGDYDIRFNYNSEDEIGELTESFNNMLNVIQDSKENLEHKVIERTKQHNEALKIKTEFLSNMSHEIRTPIHGIMNYADFLVHDWATLKESKKFNFLEKIYKNSNRLLSLINNLLDLSKLDENKMEFIYFQHDLTNIIIDILQEVEPLYIKKNINIKFDNDLGDQNFVDLDKERITQVFRNILSNAIKFTNAGEIIVKAQPTILFDRLGEDSRAISIAIEDNGIGVPENELSYIFDKFNQSTKTKTGAGGTGLGLSISKDIIKAHKGKIWAENNTDKPGITVFIILPLKQTTSIVTEKDLELQSL
jgi:signal transduction histidine kinase